MAEAGSNTAPDRAIPELERVTALDLIYAAIRILKTHHDVVDVGDGDRPDQGPNWAMRATNLLDEAMEIIAHV